MSYLYLGRFPLPNTKISTLADLILEKVNSVPPALKRSEHGQGVFVFIRLFRSRVGCRCSTEEKKYKSSNWIIATHMGSSYWMVFIIKLPSHDLTYPILGGTFEVDGPFPKVGHVSSLEGRSKTWDAKSELFGTNQLQKSLHCWVSRTISELHFSSLGRYVPHIHHALVSCHVFCKWWEWVSSGIIICIPCSSLFCGIRDSTKTGELTQGGP